MGCGWLGLNIIVSIQITGLRNTVNLRVLKKCLDPSEFKTTSISKSNEAIFKLLNMEKGKVRFAKQLCVWNLRKKQATWNSLFYLNFEKNFYIKLWNRFLTSYISVVSLYIFTTMFAVVFLSHVGILPLHRWHIYCISYEKTKSENLKNLCVITVSKGYNFL